MIQDEAKSEKWESLCKLWFVVSLCLFSLGCMTAIVYAVYWFGFVNGNCGVVRFYEQAFGAFVIGIWGLGSLTGLILTIKGYRKKSKKVVAGAMLTLIFTAGIIWTCFETLDYITEIKVLSS